MHPEAQQWIGLAVSLMTGLISALALFVCLRIKVSIAELEIQILRELREYVRKEECRLFVPHRQPLCDPPGEPA